MNYISVPEVQEAAMTNELDPNIRLQILRASGKRREKRVKFAVSDDEYAQLLCMSIQNDLTISEVIRKKLFDTE